MRTISARFGLLVLLVSRPAAAQDQPSPTPAPTPVAPARRPLRPLPPPPRRAPAPAAAAASPAWRPFQELAFLVGSWSGSAESGARVGGRVARFTPQFNGNYLVHRGSTILTADDGKEETIEEVGYFAYDREKRRYVASYFFSTGISATFDVEIAPEGVRLASRELLNAEAGTKARMLFAAMPTASSSLDGSRVPGKDFVPFLAHGKLLGDDAVDVSGNALANSDIATNGGIKVHGDADIYGNVKGLDVKLDESGVVYGDVSAPQ